MSEPNNDMRPVLIVVWIALVTAIVVTIIDWKIKQDILRLTDAFYRIYPTTMEEQHGSKTRFDPEAFIPGPTNPDPVLRFPVVDSNPGVETEAAPNAAPKDPEDHSDAWAEFAPHIDTGLEPRTTSDS